MQLTTIGTRLCHVIYYHGNKKYPCLLGIVVFSDPCILQYWTEGRSSTAVAEDLRPTATGAEV